MSFDLLVFDPAIVQYEDREAFVAWYFETAEWEGSHDYADPNSTSASLQAWYNEMRVIYPAMNGPDAVSDDDVDNPSVSDYSFSTDAVYVTFAWSEAENAFTTMSSLAQKHQLGFFNVSSEDGGVWAPNAKGEYARVH